MENLVHYLIGKVRGLVSRRYMNSSCAMNLLLRISCRAGIAAKQPARLQLS